MGKKMSQRHHVVRAEMAQMFDWPQVAQMLHLAFPVFGCTQVCMSKIVLHKALRSLALLSGFFH